MDSLEQALRDAEIKYIDLAPPEQDATETAKQNHLACLMQYSTVQRKFHEQDSVMGLNFWYDLTTLFRPANVRLLPVEEFKAWRQLLETKGVRMRRGRGISIASSFIDVITAESFPELECTQEAERQVETASTNLVEQRERADMTNNNRATIVAEDETGRNKRSIVLDQDQHVSVEKFQQDSGSKATVDLECRNLQQLQKLYQGRHKFSGGFDEDLVGCIQIYETLTKMAGCSTREKAVGLPIMLDSDALQFYAENLQLCRDYDEAISALHAQYSSEEQRSRLLKSLQTTSLTELMQQSPEKSQIEVFTEKVRTLQKTQRQLHIDYQKDRFLRDQLVISADIPDIERSLREKVASTAQEAQQRIASMLSSTPGSAGSTAHKSYALEEEVTNYGIGRRFVGGARKHRTFPRQRSGSDPAGRSKKGPRRDGCWVCGSQDHFARDKHSKEDIRVALGKLRSDGSYV